jgi:hypothetical protein
MAGKRMTWLFRVGVASFALTVAASSFAQVRRRSHPRKEPPRKEQPKAEQPRKEEPPKEVTVTFRGACGAGWRDSADRSELCARTQRPVCYSNGGCRCEAETNCR